MRKQHFRTSKGSVLVECLLISSLITSMVIGIITLCTGINEQYRLLNLNTEANLVLNEATSLYSTYQEDKIENSGVLNGNYAYTLSRDNIDISTLSTEIDAVKFTIRWDTALKQHSSPADHTYRTASITILRKI